MAVRERKIPHDLQIPWKSWGFMAFGDDGLTKKETAFRLSLWCARRDLKASHGPHPAIHRLTKPGAFFLQTDHPPTCYPQTAIARLAIFILHPTIKPVALSFRALPPPGTALKMLHIFLVRLNISPFSILLLFFSIQHLKQ